MNADLKKNKAIIRDFIRAKYSEANLVEILDFARAGKLRFGSCCCLVGIPSRDHDGGLSEYMISLHHWGTETTPGRSGPAENAFNQLGAFPGSSYDTDTVRRLRIIPMILAEIRRRRKVAHPVAPPLAKVRA